MIYNILQMIDIWNIKGFLVMVLMKKHFTTLTLRLLILLCQRNLHLQKTLYIK